MLVLTRKIGEQMCIGDTVNVTVLGVRQGRVRLGIDGPRNVPVYREEIHRRVDARQQRTAVGR